MNTINIEKTPTVIIIPIIRLIIIIGRWFFFQPKTNISIKKMMLTKLPISNCVPPEADNASCENLPEALKIASKKLKKLKTYVETEPKSKDT